MGKRLNAFGRGTWCTPGGKLEMYEDVYECARRETMEEAGIEVENLRMVGVTNDIMREVGSHFITLEFAADWKSGEARLAEPDTFETWEWFPWDNLPKPLFPPTQNFVDSGVDPFTATAIDTPLSVAHHS